MSDVHSRAAVLAQVSAPRHRWSGRPELGVMRGYRRGRQAGPTLGSADEGARPN